MAEDLSDQTVRQLLDRYVAVLNELIRRNRIRTRNAPLGDLMETTAVAAYRGVIEPNSRASYDLVAEDGRRIQVKARAMEPGARPQSFSAFRSWNFESALFVLVDATTYDIVWARELDVAEAMAIGRRAEHTNSTAVLVSQVSGRGKDLTTEFVAAYNSLDALSIPTQEPVS